MVVPAKRLSKSRSKKRRYPKSILKDLNLVLCKNCHQYTLPHRICGHCGFYKGKKYLDFQKETKKKK